MTIPATLTLLVTHLGTLSSLLDTGAAHAAELDYDVSQLLESRLTANMHPLRRQVQMCCDLSKFMGARLSGTTAPKHEDGPATLEELKTRIADVMTFLEGLDTDALANAGDTDVRLPFFPEGKCLSGDDYVAQFVLPNFYFHMTTTYAILRHNGVKIGKRDFLRHLSFRDLKA